MKVFSKNLHWTKTYFPEFELVENVVVFGSGTSVNSIPKGRIESIVNNRSNLVITMNYGIKKINSDFNFITDKAVIQWAYEKLNDRQRSKCVTHRTNIVQWIPYHFDTRAFHGRKSTYTIVNTLMAIQEHEVLKYKPIWVYGLDLYVKRDEMKYYDDVLDAGEDVNSFRKNPMKYLTECGSDLDRCVVLKDKVYNCNPASCYLGFEFKELL